MLLKVIVKHCHFVILNSYCVLHALVVSNDGFHAHLKLKESICHAVSEPRESDGLLRC